MTHSDVAQLFRTVKDCVPDFNPMFLMSDEANAFWNGFVEVYPNCSTRRLWCRWHVLRAVGKMADELLDKYTAAIVKETLKETISEPDVTRFTKQMTTFLDYLEEPSNKGKKYADYLRKNYLS
uniref:MULE transposase domain-containing protein n=2 Tax=Caenorhabditis japonica TaxID=281687 RepID=A0A8R1IS37_CAEJA